jgi:hypothetical protein
LIGFRPGKHDGRIHQNGWGPTISIRVLDGSSQPAPRPVAFQPLAVLEHAQAMAAHKSPRTTKLCDRTKERLTLDEIERIKL